MKRYKDGQWFDIPKEEADKIRERSRKYRAERKRTPKDYEARIKELENTVATLMAKLADETPVQE